jgi:cytochrome bd-type quinol oxidase subunit 1
MDLPVIIPPVAPRWVWIEEITYSHIPIATMVTALKDDRYDRLAKGFIWFSMILFSPGAALGTGIPMWIIGTYPEFWSRWSNLFFWPLIGQFCFFMLEVTFLFFAYYLTWEKMKDNKPLHITFGAVAAFWGLAVQFVWDALGAYMTTPGAPLPPVSEAVGWSAAAFFNPSFPYLFTHRFFGNISYVMMLTGGFFALRQLRQKDEGERAYYGWAADSCYTTGVLAFFAMPFIGWGYARIIQLHSPVAFHSIMGGSSSPNFKVKMAAITVLVLCGGGYLFARFRSKWLLWPFTIGVLATASIFWLHPVVRGFGGAAGWRVLHTAVPLLVLAVLWKWGSRWNPDTTFWKRVMFAGGMAACVAFLIGGFVREKSRQPHTVYGQIIKPEATVQEMDRFLFTERCVYCHPGTGEFEAWRGRDWARLVEAERLRPGVRLDNEEAGRIVDYLKEHYP